PASFFRKLSLFLSGLLCYKNYTADSSCTSGKSEQDSSISTSLRKQEVLIVDYIQNNCCISRCLLFCAFAFCISMLFHVSRNFIYSCCSKLNLTYLQIRLTDGASIYILNLRTISVCIFDIVMSCCYQVTILIIDTAMVV